MGYYTDYYIFVGEIVDGVPTDVTIDFFDRNMNVLETLIGYSNSELYEDNFYGETAYTFLDSVKWYDHEKDMAKFSKMFPDHYFYLYGDGEESGDIWKLMFHDGKVTNYKTVTRFIIDE
jgi:hypothetical protein